MKATYVEGEYKMKAVYVEGKIVHHSKSCGCGNLSDKSGNICPRCNTEVCDIVVFAKVQEHRDCLITVEEKRVDFEDGSCVCELEIDDN